MIAKHRTVAFAALLVVPASFLACAQLLSYDDYSARPNAPADTGSRPDVSTEVSDAPEGPLHVPGRPPGEPIASGKGKTLWFGMKRMYLGSLNTFGAEVADAWKEWGLDLDNVCTSDEDSKKNVGTCLRPTGANQDSLVDGNRCRDNNFGHHVVALLKVSSSGFETRLINSLLEGGNTMVLRVDDVDDGPDDTYAPGRLYRVASVKGATWDGSDIREVISDTVLDGDLEKARTSFTKGFIKDHVWVSGEPEKQALLLPVSSSLFVPLTLESATVVLELAPDHNSGKRGGIAGAIPLVGVESLLDPVAAAAGFCPGSGLYQSLWNSFQEFPDLVIGAPNLQDTTQQCNGISLGFGFDVGNIQPVTKVVDPPPPSGPDPCDAGTKG